MDSPEIKLASEDFKSKMKTVLEKLAASQEVFDALDDSGTMGYLRRDALKSINTLSIHQFTQGDTTSTYLQPSKDIFLFWNMAAAVRLGLRMQYFLVLFETNLTTHLSLSWWQRTEGLLLFLQTLNGTPTLCRKIYPDVPSEI